MSAKKAKARLEDLDVREVSVVDKPANKKRFLIVKNQDGKEIVLLTEADEMARTAIAADSKQLHGLVSIDKDDSSLLLDLLGADEEPEEKPVEKQEGKVAEWIADFSAAAIALRDGASDAIKKFNEAAASVLAFCGIEKSIDLDVKDALEATKKALASLMCLSTELGEEPLTVEKAQTVKDDLMSVAKQEQEAQQEPPAEEPKQEGLQLFVEKGEGDDCEVIIKAGAKMKKTRLSALKAAVETLQSLLAELEGQAKEKTTKSEDDDQVLKAISTLGETFGAKLNEMKTVFDGELAKVSKRIDDIDTAPAGNAEAEEQTEVKKSKNIWDGMIFDQPA